MKIAIDYSLVNSHKGGMRVFIENIVKELKKHDKNNEYVIFNNPIPFKSQNILLKIISVFKQHFWYQTSFINLLNKNNIDILYSPNPPIPLFFDKKIILTIPDMAFFYEKNIPFFSRIYLYIEYYIAARKADKITTFSHYSKNDIGKILKIGLDKIIVIPLAASDKFQKSVNKKNIERTLQKYQIKSPYVLCTPGSFLPRKNIKDLILAVHNLPNNVRKKLSIVLVGNNSGKHFFELKLYIEHLKMGDNVIFTGHLAPESHNLINIYSAAKLFIYPSLYEGFGLPPLESMKIGVPVVVYNKTSLPEVVDNAGIIVNNHNELTEAISEVLIKRNLYKKIVKLGLKRSKKFSWSASASQFKEVFDLLN